MKKSLVFGTLICIAVCSCNLAGPKKLQLTDADNNKKVEANTGQEVVLKLRENPSTGYKWSITSPASAFMQLQDNEYKTDPGSEDRDGAGGTHTWHYKLLKPGTAELTMIYSRSWEKEQTGNPNFKVTVNVK